MDYVEPGSVIGVGTGFNAAVVYDTPHGRLVPPSEAGHASFAFRGEREREIEAKMLAGTPIKRLGEVEDISGAILYFAAPISGWVRGQLLFVNGGGVQTLD